ncbi:hypothetical protein GCM10028778_23140 [Barrientosiimonas marina]|uniref:Deacetylase PdaC domain-containing protein n=1 Tax=Lentibacillus kimchii TaxID=1542911 RepID=A0ABW2UXN9_9BACI
MGRLIKSKSLYVILAVVLLVVFSVRIEAVNDDRDHYETYRVDVQNGDVVTLGDLEMSFGEATSPKLEESENQANGKKAVYKLPIKITKKSDAPLKSENQFAIYEKYKDYINLPLVDYHGKLNNQGVFSTLSSLKKDESVNLTVSTDFVVGDLYYYYDDYNTDKAAYIVIVGPQSEKGMPLYYYKL